MQELVLVQELAPAPELVLGKITPCILRTPARRPHLLLREVMQLQGHGRSTANVLRTASRSRGAGPWVRAQVKVM